MPLALSHIGQIALAVADVDRAEVFYEQALGLRKLYRFGDLTFFDCAGVRLMLEKAHAVERSRCQGGANSQQRRLVGSRDHHDGAGSPLAAQDFKEFIDLATALTD